MSLTKAEREAVKAAMSILGKRNKGKRKNLTDEQRAAMGERMRALNAKLRAEKPALT